MAAASSFEAKSRNNSFEGPANGAKKSADAVKTVSPNCSIVEKKEKAVPPPRKSSDPNQKVASPPIMSPPIQPAKAPVAPVPVASVPIPKAESPKVKHQVSNGTLPQNIQSPPPPVTIQPPTGALAPEPIKPMEEVVAKAEAGGESNGVGDKIRKFERAAEDATVGRTSRPGSVRGRVRGEINDRNSNSGSNPSIPENIDKAPAKDDARGQLFSPTSFSKWRKEEPETPIPSQKNPAPKADEKEMKPSIKFNKFPQDLPTKSPALGARTFVDRKPSAALASDATSPTQPTHVHRPAARKEMESDDLNTQFKTCKSKPKERYSTSKPSAYFSRGTEEIWLVKKKDIEEIEDRVMESFRRAGAGSCRSEPIREFPSFTAGSATLGRTKRAMYARSESLDPQYAAARSQTLKRQSSVACTCGHDKKNRSKSSGASTPASDASGPPRPRSRSHGDDHSQAHILDKYETLV